VSAGSLSAADKTKIDALPAAASIVTTARTLTAGAGLAGGGDLSANRTFSVPANGVVASMLGSGAAGSGAVATADGAGNVTYVAPSGGTPGVIFDGGSGAAGSPKNIRSDRGTDQQHLTNTFVGLTVLGSDTVGGHTTQGDYGTIGGGNRNVIGNNGASTHGTIAGGLANVIGTGSNHCSIGGGFNNTIPDATGDDCTISGGISNVASNTLASIGGGSSNTCSGNAATIAGGNSNTAGGTWSAVGGGLSNQATGQSSCIPGGRTCVASGIESFAHGNDGSATRCGQYSHGAGVANNTRYGRVLYTGTLPGDGVTATVELVYGSSGDKFTPENGKGYALFVEAVIAQDGIAAGTPKTAILTMFAAMGSNSNGSTINVSTLTAVAAGVGDANLLTSTLAASISSGKLKLLFTGPVLNTTPMHIAATMRWTEIGHS
jgi:hypothetical protein